MGKKETYVYKYNSPKTVGEVVSEVLTGPSYSLKGKEVEK